MHAIAAARLISIEAMVRYVPRLECPLLGVEIEDSTGNNGSAWTVRAGKFDACQLTLEAWTAAVVVNWFED